MRVLASIINHGTQNDRHLRRLLDAYRRMTCDVDLVVHTNRAKHLGSDVEVRVEVPAEGPRYLPLMPRRLFVERADEYDVYIASEDDTLVTERHVRAFVEASQHSGPTAVPGFLRFEEWPPEQEIYIDMLHRYFGWDPFSTYQSGEWMFAEVTNVHSAVYLLTRAHLAVGIASGRFEEIHRPTREYATLEAASTHVFENCGLRKVVPINRLDDFLIHHLPNKFHAWRMGLAASRLEAQRQALVEIVEGTRAPRQLIDVQTRLRETWWDKCFDEPVRDDLRQAAEPAPADLFWLGASGSDAEEALLAQGHRMTSLPLDSVVANVAEQQGATVTPADLDEGLAAVEGQSFDVVFAVSMLERLPDPVGLLQRLGGLLRPDGQLVFIVPNMDRWWGWPHDSRRLSDVAPVGRPWTFEETGLHFTTSQRVCSWFAEAGMTVSLTYPRPDGYRRYDWPTLGLLRHRMAEHISGVAHLSRRPADLRPASGDRSTRGAGAREFVPVQPGGDAPIIPDRRGGSVSGPASPKICYSRE